MFLIELKKKEWPDHEIYDNANDIQFVFIREKKTSFYMN